MQEAELQSIARPAPCRPSHAHVRAPADRRRVAPRVGPPLPLALPSPRSLGCAARRCVCARRAAAFRADTDHTHAALRCPTLYVNVFKGAPSLTRGRFSSLHRGISPWRRPSRPWVMPCGRRRSTYLPLGRHVKEPNTQHAALVPFDREASLTTSSTVDAQAGNRSSCGSSTGWRFHGGSLGSTTARPVSGRLANCSFRRAHSSRTSFSHRGSEAFWRTAKLVGVRALD